MSNRRPVRALETKPEPVQPARHSYLWRLSKFRKAWEQKWFTLDRNGFVSAKTPQGLALCKPVFDEGLPEQAWPEMRVTAKDHGVMMFGMTVKSDEGETVTLHSPDRFLRDAWVQTINMAAKARRSNMYINDRFSIDFQKPLGTGLFAVVLQGQEISTGTNVAIKVIKADAYKEYKDLIEQLCEGGNLMTSLANRPYYCERDVASLMRQLVEAVQHCHRQGIVHCDLKPENIVLQNKSPDSPIKLIDFSLASFFNTSTEPGGTPEFVAPELLIKPEQYAEYGCGPSVDVWALGVILYYLLCGTTPFYAKTMDAIIERVKSGVWDFSGPCWHQVSPEAMDLIEMLLQFNPKDRASSLSLLDHPWFRMHSTQHRTGVLRDALRGFKVAWTAPCRWYLELSAFPVPSGGLDSALPTASSPTAAAAAGGTSGNRSHRQRKVSDGVSWADLMQQRVPLDPVTSPSHSGKLPPTSLLSASSRGSGGAGMGEFGGMAMGNDLGGGMSGLGVEGLGFSGLGGKGVLGLAGTASTSQVPDMGINVQQGGVGNGSGASGAPPHACAPQSSMGPSRVLGNRMLGRAATLPTSQLNVPATVAVEAPMQGLEPAGGSASPWTPLHDLIAGDMGASGPPSQRHLGSSVRSRSAAPYSVLSRATTTGYAQRPRCFTTRAHADGSQWSRSMGQVPAMERELGGDAWNGEVMMGNSAPQEPVGLGSRSLSGTAYSTRSASQTQPLGLQLYQEQPELSWDAQQQQQQQQQQQLGGGSISPEVSSAHTTSSSTSIQQLLALRAQLAALKEEKQRRQSQQQLLAGGAGGSGSSGVVDSILTKRHSTPSPDSLSLNLPQQAFQPHGPASMPNSSPRPSPSGFLNSLSQGSHSPVSRSSGGWGGSGSLPHLPALDCTHLPTITSEDNVLSSAPTNTQPSSFCFPLPSPLGQPGRSSMPSFAGMGWEGLPSTDRGWL
ncbi:hypothetical protein DUNSADRAFT_13159 [Dunaliella salina]|uniref:Protein kinase domain-containing protein n=1 Tax=Dunaliella salina TaxID=3046 RepID=A0ABQ7G9Z3_DUNSA|nr:hypothetical protein DUNSADRAFT_13159 [Dunaliella salina]|eukprot:KAF5831424.1 hypothetical protein DUNSADRAFT_13159 [Dunaliella salina]